MKQFPKLIGMLLACSLLFTACGRGAESPGSTSTDPTATPVQKLSADSVALLTLSQEQAGNAQTGAVAFSLELLRGALDGEDGNAVISPLSAYLALAMATRGACGDTRTQMQTLLGANADEIAAFANEETRRLTGSDGSASITLANSVWADDEFQISAKYVEDLQSWFAAESYSCELSSSETREKINDWVSVNTQGLIPKLLDENLSETSMLALINTLYMKARWQTPFDAQATESQTFTTDTGNVIHTPTMHATEWYPYCELPDGGKAVLLRYADCELAFLAILPPQGVTGEAYVKTLTASALADCPDMEEQQVSLYLPKFETDYSILLNRTLKSLGMTDAFDARADFSGMSDTQKDLYISTVLQKSKIIVDEDGTEAAAATAIVMESKSAMISDEPVELRFDRSFVYAVVDTASGMPLFAGVESNPAE